MAVHANVGAIDVGTIARLARPAFDVLVAHCDADHAALAEMPLGTGHQPVVLAAHRNRIGIAIDVVGQATPGDPHRGVANARVLAIATQMVADAAGEKAIIQQCGRGAGMAFARQPEP